MFSFGKKQVNNVESIVIDKERDVRMPSIGFGCAFGNWTDQSKFIGFQPDLGWAAISAAIRVGYNHFDGALVYGSHSILGQSIGKGFADGTFVRDDIFVTSKVYHPCVPLSLNTQGHAFPMDKINDANFSIKDRITFDIERSLAETNLGYLDLVLMHWPGPVGSYGEDEEENMKNVAINKAARLEVWRAMEEAYKCGKVRAIGVSNFMERHFDFLDECEIKPACNQIEISPYIQQRDIQDFCQKNGIKLVAWAPLGSGATGVLSDPTIKELAGKYKKNAGQIILRWLTQQGIAALPKSSNEGRMKSNLEIFDFKLTDEEIKSINALEQEKSSVFTSGSIA